MKKTDDHQAKKIKEITMILARMRDDELIDDLRNQLVSAYKTFLNMQNKHINSMLFEVDNFFEGIEDDSINDRIEKSRLGKKKT